LRDFNISKSGHEKKLPEHFLKGRGGGERTRMNEFAGAKDLVSSTFERLDLRVNSG
jgi:hypothetical protein